MNHGLMDNTTLCYFIRSRRGRGTWLDRDYVHTSECSSSHPHGPLISNATPPPSPPFRILSEVLHKPLDDRMRAYPFSCETLSRSPNVRTDSVVQKSTADHEHVRLDVCLKEAVPSHHHPPPAGSFFLFPSRSLATFLPSSKSFSAARTESFPRSA